MPRQDGTPTINEMLKDMRAEVCEACGGELPPWDDNPAGMNDPPWRNGDTCSEACFRKNAGKTWPKEEDCPGCPCHKDGPHKFGCTIGGARQIKIPVKLA